MAKSKDAFRTISEVADWLETPAHVLRFWESKFNQVRPVKRAGGRRYYRPDDMALLGGIKALLHNEGMTIKGVQKLLREQGVAHVAALAPPRIGEEDEGLVEAEALPAPNLRLVSDEVAEELPEVEEAEVEEAEIVEAELSEDSQEPDVEPEPVAEPELDAEAEHVAKPEAVTEPEETAEPEPETELVAVSELAEPPRAEEAEPAAAPASPPPARPAPKVARRQVWLLGRVAAAKPSELKAKTGALAPLIPFLTAHRDALRDAR
ncbi:MerR family transcriptional regulator [Pseudoroseicyclus sp. H15]